MKNYILRLPGDFNSSEFSAVNTSCAIEFMQSEVSRLKADRATLYSGIASAENVIAFIVNDTLHHKN